MDTQLTKRFHPKSHLQKLDLKLSPFTSSKGRNFDHGPERFNYRGWEESWNSFENFSLHVQHDRDVGVAQDILRRPANASLNLKANFFFVKAFFNLDLLRKTVPTFFQNWKRFTRMRRGLKDLILWQIFLVYSSSWSFMLAKDTYLWNKYFRFKDRTEITSISPFLHLREIG